MGALPILGSLGTALGGAGAAGAGAGGLGALGTIGSIAAAGMNGSTPQPIQSSGSYVPQITNTTPPQLGLMQTMVTNPSQLYNQWGGNMNG